MSRCYPYPPPGYAGKCSSHEALILSIKLQKEKEKALSAQEGEKSKSFEKKKDKEDRKDKKRDREDRKKDKKDKEDRKKEKKEKRREKKAKLGANTETGKQNVVADKLAKADNVLPESKGKLQGSSCELVERSSVTEEHGQPIDSQNVSCSSDSTGNSGKRRKTLSSPSGTQSNGNILRIRLTTSQKRDEPSTSGSKLQEVGSLSQTRGDIVTSYSHVQPCFARVKPESSNKQKGLISNVECLPCPASTSNATLQLVSTDASGLKQKTNDAVSQSVKLASSHEKVQSKEHPIEKLSSHERRMQKKDSLYKKLIVDWVPPPLESTLLVDENDEEDWLFGKKGDDKSAKSLRVGDDVGSSRDNLPCSASYAMQPRARYLADAEIFALPFTVPF